MYSATAGSQCSVGVVTRVRAVRGDSRLPHEPPHDNASAVGMRSDETTPGAACGALLGQLNRPSRAGRELSGWLPPIVAWSRVGVVLNLRFARVRGENRPGRCSHRRIVSLASGVSRETCCGRRRAARVSMKKKEYRAGPIWWGATGHRSGKSRGESTAVSSRSRRCPPGRLRLAPNVKKARGLGVLRQETGDCFDG